MAEPLSPQRQAWLDGIRDEVCEAVLEGDAQDCSSADCIADAVYEIVRVGLATLDTAADGMPELAAAAKAFLDTTHGNELGHDHHCRVVDGPWPEDPPDALSRCSCGWSRLALAWKAVAYHAEGAGG